MATLAYEGELQSDRPINATRINDELYIFTGTYPLYYKGDGRLYLLPEHQTTYNEVLIAGHNTMMDNFDQYYYNQDISITDFSDVNTLGKVSIKDFKYNPELPFVRKGTDNELQAQLEAKISFSLPQEVFDVSGSDYYFIGLSVYERPSVVGSTDEDYTQITSKITVTTAPIENRSVYYVPGPTAPNLGDVALLMTQGNINQNHFTVKINGLTEGLKDLKFVLTADLNGGNDAPFDFTDTVEISEITISAAKIEDYPNEENPDRGDFKLKAPWTCNQVIEHYGQLLTWGSEIMPSTLFISNNDNLNYFPSLYPFTFETDENEPITSVTPFMNILVLQSKSYTWGIKGTNPVRFLDGLGQIPNPNAYQPFSINASVGSIAPKAVRPVRNRLYFLSQEGLMELTSLFATDDRYNVKPLDRNIFNLIPQDREAVAIQFDNQYWINFPSTGETFRYYIDKQAWVRDTYNFDEFNGVYRFYNRDGRLHIITHPMRIEDEGNYQLYEAIVDKSLATDLDQPVTTQFLTSKMNQDYPFHWKRYKELKFDFTVQNEYMPNKAPITLTSKSSEIVDSNVEIVFGSNDFIPFHSYTLAVNENIIPEEGDEVIVNNGNLTGVFKDKMIRFTLKKDIPETVSIVFPVNNLSTSDIEDFTVVDDTYDPGLNYNLRVMADNNTMIRDDFKSYVPIEKNINTGSQFNNVIFASTNFGDVTTFVQTNKLYGNGYDINVYYRDESNIKWTLETMGITYKMRRTRSDRRG